ncbi:hypothetical protein CLV72_11227 [Allonocardiopsis opalescens]|uniref:Uncharacterized protein n=1 Tax=Allonocardiopsis opalescens TaxID=1144618 RepID=A0A2T0PSS6_9ACTN|nr:hypothetical protein [Allonocardiopsis opalescens]PRX91954.1 hypothetical protein CLV72_11227 [Allonocardiopsis opalescens]
MGREVRRVPLDFDWPLGKVWEGFLLPERLREEPCPDCESGYSPHAEHLFNLWWGHLPFTPESNGSTSLRSDTPAVRAVAERNVAHAPAYYGAGEDAIAREAQRLANLWNGMWCYHLNQDDVDALVAADRLWDLTRTCRPGEGWKKTDPPVVPTAEQVNEWSLRGFGHDAINSGVVISARCEREGVDATCATCKGHATIQSYPGQRADAEAWEPTEPPKGAGWQLWETVSEGSPVSPVAASADALAEWMSNPERGRDWVPAETARQFVERGWAPSGVFSAQTGLVSGVEYVGWAESERRDRS